MLKHDADSTYSVMMKSQKTPTVFSEEHYHAVNYCKILQITAALLQITNSTTILSENNLYN